MRTTGSRWGRCLVAAGFVSALSACPPEAERAETVRSGDVRQDAGDDGARGRPWRTTERGVIGDAATGLQLELPGDWEIRRGSGDAIWEARARGGAGPSLTLGRWGGSIEGLIEAFEAAEEGWLSSGPFADLEALSDGPPLVSTRQGPDGALVFGWYLSLEGTGLAIEASIPAAAFEDGWREVDAIVRSARRERR